MGKFEEYLKTLDDKYISGVYEWADFQLLVSENSCIRDKIVNIYLSRYPGNEREVNKQNVQKYLDDPSNKNKKIIQASGKVLPDGIVVKEINAQISLKKYNLKHSKSIDVTDEENSAEVNRMADWVWRNYKEEAKSIVKSCLQKKKASDKSNENKNTNISSIENINSGRDPFDRRLSRFEAHRYNDDHPTLIVPYSLNYQELSTTGYIITSDAIENSTAKNKEDLKRARSRQYDEMSKDDFYKGVPALQNTYALIRLYGSKGGNNLVNQKGQRKWYEVDEDIKGRIGVSTTPTTSALISWGNGDPYGRTPYHFTDFVFCKYWKKIENNRLITLRRYAAPILDNLNFPGMTSNTNPGSSETGGKEDAGSIPNNVSFPPMATAVTYFGEGTSNSLNSLLKFTTGFPWEDVQASVWEANTESVPDNNAGPAGLYGGLAKFAEMLNVAGGNFNKEYIFDKGHLPPDPYKDGPYENRIIGPVNRIDSVKKRKPGLIFNQESLNITFEYVARPVGGINPKAVLLDILSNFLVMGSATAVFFGGAHRFMANPAMYPFLGGDEGIEKWYQGKPIEWGMTVIKQFAHGGSESKQSSGGKNASILGAGTNILESVKGFFSNLFSGEKGSGFEALTSLFSGGIGNIISNEMAKKSAGQIPFMTGMKAILTGEPVGEWHLTIGNPLNPIAMIGNLVCDNISVEFNDELGPDDFPTEIKIVVTLKHAMARDRDAIESMFNRGMGRIYSLPESFLGSADYQTVVDQATKTRTQVGTAPGAKTGIVYKNRMSGRNISSQELKGKEPSNHGSEVTIWNRASFSLGISENSTIEANTNEIFRSAYRTADWIAMKSLQ